MGSGVGMGDGVDMGDGVGMDSGVSMSRGADMSGVDMMADKNMKKKMKTLALNFFKNTTTPSMENEDTCTKLLPINFVKYCCATSSKVFPSLSFTSASAIHCRISLVD